jgi:hypothetical protein
MTYKTEIEELHAIARQGIERTASCAYARERARNAFYFAGVFIFATAGTYMTGMGDTHFQLKASFVMAMLGAVYRAELHYHRWQMDRLIKRVHAMIGENVRAGSN